MTYLNIAKQHSRMTAALLVILVVLAVTGLWTARALVERTHSLTQGDLQIVEATGELSATAAEPAVLLLNADAFVATINGGKVNLTARVRDAEGKAVAGVNVLFASAQGSVAPANVTTNADGIATTTFTAGSQAGQAIVTVDVNALTREATIQVVKPNDSATAHTITLQPSTTKVSLSQQIDVSAILLDGSGQPLVGEVISVFGSMGEVSPASAVSDANGKVTFTYRAGSLPGQAMLTALAGYASATTNLQVGTINAPGQLDQKQFLPTINRP